MQFLQSGILGMTLAAAGIALVAAGYSSPATFETMRPILPIIFISIALGVILFAFSFRESGLKAWQYLITGHIYIIAAVIFNADHINLVELVYYTSGVLLAFLLGYYCLQRIKTIDNDISLNRFHGYVYEQETTGFLFLLSAMGMLGFPITAAFVGIDVLFTYVHSGQTALVILLALCFVFIELAAFRILLRIFFGPHKKLDHPVAFRSS